MDKHATIKRREFLGAAGAALAAPYFVPNSALAAPGRLGANDRITIGHIGVGGMGGGHLGRGLKFRELGMANVAAV